MKFNFPLMGQQKKRDQVLSIDLGGRTTKAVLLQRSGNGFRLARYSIKDAPVYEQGFSAPMLAEHLRDVAQSLEPKTRQMTLSISANDCILRGIELPLLPVNQMRQMLRLNSKGYLQHDLSDHTFDCYIVPPDPKTKTESLKGSVQKFKVWAGGAKTTFINDIQTAIKTAGFIPDEVALTIVGPVNAFEFAHPDIFATKVVALVDLGFKHSTINIVSKGNLLLSRVVEIGGDKLTSGLSESMGISYAEAEGIKVGMPAEVEGHLQPLVAPLGRELRASVDFFEHQNDQHVESVYISGGAARSDYIREQLQTELMITCETWNPARELQVDGLPPQQVSELEQMSSQLAVAMGAASAAM
ncbi:MAG: pilus assembly protein PilM [Limisphaerales bacterium]